VKPAPSVDAYIAQAPKAVQGKLRDLRAAIKTAAPTAKERISYGIPYYEYSGRLVYFGLWKKHVAMYALGDVVDEHRGELKGYETATATIHFPLDQDLPLALIKKLVKARMRKNDEAESKKTMSPGGKRMRRPANLGRQTGPKTRR
jgi:uncharacterized protein YdhG (YjbR/CyaY superfamily)